MRKAIFFSILTLAFLGVVFVSAQETPQTTFEDIVSLDEKISPQELGVGEPSILPDSPLYFFKNLGRGLRSFFTFSPEKKAELQIRFASEKLLEAEKLAEKGKSEAALKHLQEYHKDLRKINELTNELSQKNKKAAERVIKQVIERQFKHQIILEKFEKSIPPESTIVLKKQKEEVLNEVGEMLAKEDDLNQLKEIIKEALEKNQEGSKFKPLRNLAVLKAVEEKVPETAKEAIKLAQEESLKRFHKDLMTLSEDEKELLKEYIEKSGGDELMWLKVLDEAKKIDVPEEIEEKFSAAKERVVKRLVKKIEEVSQKDPTLADKFLDSLKDGSFEDLRVIKELEGEVSPVVLKPVFEVKKEALVKFKENLERAPAEKKEKIIDEILEDTDIKTLDIIKELQETAEAKDKDYIDDLKEKAIEKIKKELEEAKDVEERKVKLRAIIGDRPEDIKTVEEFRQDLGNKVAQEILSQQVEFLEKRIAQTKDPILLKELEEKIKAQEIKNIILKEKPVLIERLSKKAEELSQKIGPKEAKARIERAKSLLEEFKGEVEGLPDEDRREKIEKLLETAEKHLKLAEKYFEENEYGKAFGQATAALNVLRGVKEAFVIKEVLKIEPVKPLPVSPKLEKVEVKPQRVSPINVVCTQQYEPVCGIDGKTYSNKCVAEKQHGVKVAYEGPCTSTPPLLKVEQVTKVAEVSVRNFEFQPQEVKVLAGGVVIFTNYDDAVHNVRGDVVVEDMKKGEKREWKAPEKPGVYEFYCSYHPSMKGKIIVR